jgi:hypothetical protein
MTISYQLIGINESNVFYPRTGSVLIKLLSLYAHIVSYTHVVRSVERYPVRTTVDMCKFQQIEDQFD